MGALARNQASNCANPVLDVFTSVNGVLTDVFLLEFQIFDVSDATKLITPVQVFPTIVGTRATVAVGTLCPVVGAGKLSTGRFVATYTPVLTEPLGTHRIKWFFKLQATSPEQTFQEEFEVLPEATATGETGYCFVSDLRDEGVPATFTDAVLLQKIAFASRFIDRMTGQFFEPRTRTYKLDGRGGRILQLGLPVISVATVKFETSPFQPSSLDIDPSLLRIYNRHISQGLVQPDDRQNPKIELYHASDDITNASPYVFTRLIFPHGQQNIEVNGVFGYTDPDPPSMTGKTPELIRHACKLLVLRNLQKLYPSAVGGSTFNKGPIQSERTRDQAVTFDTSALAKRVGAFTGDPEIDYILASFMRPPALGAA